MQLQGSVWGSGFAGTVCALAALGSGNHTFWQVLTHSHAQPSEASLQLVTHAPHTHAFHQSHGAQAPMLPAELQPAIQRLPPPPLQPALDRELVFRLLLLLHVLASC